jgi:RNA polymerase sigma factor (sigma-70 family)
MTFRPLPNHELHLLDDERLIEYLRDARAAGELQAARRALMFLIYGYEHDVKRRLSLRVPKWAIDDVAHDALVRAVAAAFDGSSQGEFRSWLNTIVERTAIDFYRRAERRPTEAPLPSEHIGDEQVWGDEPFVESAEGAVALRLIIEEVLGELSEKHRHVIELHVFAALPAADVCDTINGMTADNVAQIASRFRARLRERLDLLGGGGS